MGSSQVRRILPTISAFFLLTALVSRAEVAFKANVIPLSIGVGQNWSIDMRTQFLSNVGSGNLSWAFVNAPSCQTNPAWMKIDSAQSRLSGTPAAGDIAVVTVCIGVRDEATGEGGGFARLPSTVFSFTSNPLNLGVQIEDSPFETQLSTVVTSPRPTEPITYTETGLAANAPWLSLSSIGRLFGTPRRTHVGPYSGIELIGRTPSGGEIRILAQGSVQRLPKAPKFKTKPTVLPNASERSAYSQSLAALVEDPDGEGTTKFKKLSGPAWIEVLPDGTVKGNPLRPDVGPVSNFVVEVSNATAVGADTSAVNFRVLKVPRPPQWNPILLTNALEDSEYAFELAPLAKDLDNEPLKFSPGTVPSWMKVSEAGRVSGIPKLENVGPFTASFKVCNLDLCSEAGGAAQVIRKPRPPTLDAVKLSFKLKHTETLTVDLIATGAVKPENGEPLTFTPAANGLDFLSLSPSGILNIKPKFKDINTATNPSWSLNFNVRDSKLGIDGKITVVIERDRRPPQWTSDSLRFKTPARVPFSKDLKPFIKELDGLPFSCSPVSGPGWLQVSQDCVLGGTPQDINLGDNPIIVKARNDILGADKEIVVEVLFKNHPPIWTTDPIRLPDARALEDYAQTVKPFATDEDGDPLTFRALNAPAWITFNSDGSLSGRPTRANEGENSFRVRVSDNQGDSAEATVLIRVLRPLFKPQWTQNPIRLPDAVEGESFVFDLKPLARDELGRPLSFRRGQTDPVWLQVASDGGLSGVPTKPDVGEYTTQFIASNEDGEALVQAFGRVLPQDLAPIINGPIKFQVKVREKLEDTLSRFVSDPEGAPLKYQATGILPAWITLGEDGKVSLSPTKRDKVGTYTFNFSVKDAKNTTNGSFEVQVLPNPRPPRWLEDPIRFTADAGVLFSKSIRDKVVDDDGLNITCIKGSGPEWLRVDGECRLSGTPSEADVGPNAFTVKASNGDAEASVQVLIDVISGIKPPFWTQDPIKLPDAKVTKLYNQSLAPFAKDPNPGAVLVFSKKTGPEWAVITGSGNVVGTPQESDLGLNKFQVLVTNQVTQKSAEVTVLINVVPLGPPRWTKNPIPLGEAFVGQDFEFNLAQFAVDDEDLPLTFSIVRGPRWLKVTEDGKLFGRPVESDLGDFTAVFRVVNSAGKQAEPDADGFGRVVKPQVPPKIFAENLFFVVKAKEVLEDDLNQEKYVVSPDGQPLKFELIGAEPWITLKDTGALRIAPDVPQVGDHEFTLKVTNRFNLTTTAPLRVRVLPLDTKPPVWLEDPIRFIAYVDKPFSASVADKAKDPNDPPQPLTFAKKTGTVWLQVSPRGSLTGTPRLENLGENVFVLTVRNDQLGSDVTVIVEVRRGEPIIDDIAIDAPVPGARVDNVWVVDNLMKGDCGDKSCLVEALERDISTYYSALDAVKIHHAGVYLSSDDHKYNGKPRPDPSGQVLLTWLEDASESFIRRMRLSPGDPKRNSPTKAFFSFVRSRELGEPIPTPFLERKVPTEVLVASLQRDQFKKFQAPGGIDQGWNASDYAKRFNEFHKSLQKPFRISAIAPECPKGGFVDGSRGIGVKPCPPNPCPPSPPPGPPPGPPQPPCPPEGCDDTYKILTERTGGKLYPYQCQGDLRDELSDYAKEVIFRTFILAKQRIKLSKVPVEPKDIEVRLAGEVLPGNTGAASDKWVYDPATNEVVISWDKIDISKLRPGDRIEIRYRG